MSRDGSLTIDWHSENLSLLPHRAVHWPRRATLIIADPHLGKAASFRASGVPVPSGTTSADLERLTSIILLTDAQRLVILGDLLHSRHGRTRETIDALGAWRSRHASLDVLVIRGNHDLHAGDPPERWRFVCLNGPILEPPLAFAHEPMPIDGVGVLAGHVHPGARLQDGDDTLRAPCFFFRDDWAVLPAFGTFTGLHPVRPRARSADHVFAVGPDQVVEILSARPSVRSAASKIQLGAAPRAR